MPTGYTADVADGKVSDLKPFALRLARGMGALIMMRDYAWDAPIPERFEPSTYNAERLAEVQAERQRLYAMSDEEAQREANAEHAAWVESREKSRAEHVERRKRYDAMLEKVRAWQGAPEGIKEFGIEQLERGRDFDCPEPWRYWSEEPPKDGAAWKSAKLDKVAHDVQYHSAEHGKEVARTEGRNAWLAQLRLSLEGTDDAAEIAARGEG